MDNEGLITEQAIVAVAKRLGIPNPAGAVRELLAAKKEGETPVRSSLLTLYWRSHFGTRAKAVGIKIDAYPDLFDGINVSLDDEAAVEEVTSQLESGFSSVDASYFDRNLDDIIHFSSKWTHSSASGSVFVPVTRTSRLPYLFSATIQSTGVALPVDLPQNGGPRRLIEVINGEAKDIQPYDSAVLDWHKSRPGRVVSGRRVDSRVRQILIPRDGGYVSISPLHAAGISRIIAGVRAEKREAGEYLGGANLPLRIGGDKSFNVTSHRGVTSTALYHLPSVDTAIPLLKRILHKGFVARVPKATIIAYVKWYAVGPGSMQDRDTVAARLFERKTSPLYPIIYSAIASISEAISIVAPVLDRLSEEELALVDDSSPLARGIIFGRFPADAVEELTAQIKRMIVREMRNVGASYTHATDSRHQTAVEELFRDKFKVEYS